MEGWRYNAIDKAFGIRSRQIGVAFEAHQSHFLPDEHLWILRSVRDVAALTAFFPHRCVLEREGPALFSAFADVVVHGRHLYPRMIIS